MDPDGERGALNRGCLANWVQFRVKNIICVAGGFNAPVIHDNDIVCELCDFVRGVADEEDGGIELLL